MHNHPNVQLSLGSLLLKQQRRISKKLAAGFVRIGEKLVSRERLVSLISEILEKRAKGATQAEVASILRVERAFVSHLEGLGEVRRGCRVALVGFPVGNKEEVGEVATAHGVDFVYLLSEHDRIMLASQMSGADIFNEVLETLASLKDYDVVVLLASDNRIATLQKILDHEVVVSVSLGASPLTEDQEVDIKDLNALFANLLKEGDGAPGRERKFGIFKKKSRSGGRPIRGEV